MTFCAMRKCQYVALPQEDFKRQFQYLIRKFVQVKVVSVKGTFVGPIRYCDFLVLLLHFL